MIKYIDLGKDIQLNQIVLAGSHDAGITEGGKNIKTQDLDILGQARSGVRFFDLRVVARTVVDPNSNVKHAKLSTFHADKNGQRL